MFSKKEFLKEEKDCAYMLVMSLEEYHEYVNNTKVPRPLLKNIIKEKENMIILF